MNIGFYHDAAGTRHAGGIAVYTQQMAAALSRSNDVYLYTQRGEPAPIVRESDVTVVETPSFDSDWPASLEESLPVGSQDWTKARMTLWAERNGVIDHIDDTLDVLFTAHYLDDLLLSNLVDVPTVYTYHRLSDIGIGAKLQQAFSATELILANSPETADRVESAFDVDVEEIVYPGVDTDRFRPDADPVISSRDPIILFVGRLVEAKGIDELLEAVARLEGDQELHVVGRGDRERIRRRARDLGIAASVELHGEVPHPELPGYHAGADVFCLPSHDESFAMANVEAMACGLPVVTTDLEAIQTYLANGDNGLLSRVGDPQDLADKLKLVFESPELRARLGEQARTDAQAFAWRTQARRLEAFCSDVLDVEEEIEEVRPDQPRPNTV
ncbi:glycosyl transferase group 1 [Haloterrigena salina JCM 13891]|uniref:Glycosyl transferase group 1 n=1 Tax=Haloterrigena salina JCM 13891 TaxID=1227488 RepID=M0C199_9EURY|nr:glycosyltransferase family 4 protein [Haloterrigena salina]ELZ16112.1 glycosyl transferase group 1 [Haloterrigena salina JCM 13891]